MTTTRTQRTLGLALALTMAAAAMVVLPAGTTAAGEPLRFGMGAGSATALEAVGVKPDYGVFWVGPWSLKSGGWNHPDYLLEDAYNRGITPVVHFYYWGDDITPSCVENGCWSSLHGAQKDKAGWSRLATELVDHLDAKMKGREAVIIIETEFNKGGIETYEPYDGYLAEKADYFNANYPASRTVLGFGNWNSAAWSNFDRAAAAAEWTGIQGMRGSTRNSLESYKELAESVVSGASTLQSKFGKPVLVTDLALSSYPEPDWVEHQRAELADVFARLGALKAAGVTGVIYRDLYDNPNFDLANYFGVAERYWGMVSSNGAAKPSRQVWIDGVNAERQAPSPSTSTSSPAPTTSAAPPASQAREAEAFATRTAGGRQSYTGASGGAVWNLWSNGAIEDQFTTGEGTHEVRIAARGMLLGSVAPHMVVKLDGATLLEADPLDGSFQTFKASRALASGPHTVRIEFTNDAATSSEDRNLLVDVVAIDAVAAPSPTPSPTSSTTTAPAPPPTSSTTTTPAPPPAPIKVEVEGFTTKSAGGRMSDSAASGGALWNLWSNGYAQNGLDASHAGSYDLKVRAKGTLVNNVGPRMVVKVDGAIVGQADLGTTWRDVVVRLPQLAQGSHTVRIEFTNDAKTSKEDRNLLLDVVTLDAASAPPPAPIKVEVEGFTTKSTGARQSESTASGGALWNLWSNGHVQNGLDASQTGSYDLRVRAKGTLANGVGPHMIVKVDGATVAQADLGTSWRDVTVRLAQLSQGSHTVRIEFTNDAKTSSEDRNLLLDRVELAAA